MHAFPLNRTFDNVEGANFAHSVEVPGVEAAWKQTSAGCADGGSRWMIKNSGSYVVDLPPTQDSSGKCRLEFLTEHVINLVVTVTGWGYIDASYVFVDFGIQIASTSTRWVSWLVAKTGTFLVVYRM